MARPTDETHAWATSTMRYRLRTDYDTTPYTSFASTVRPWAPGCNRSSLRAGNSRSSTARVLNRLCRRG